MHQYIYICVLVNYYQKLDKKSICYIYACIRPNIYHMINSGVMMVPRGGCDFGLQQYYNNNNNNNTILGLREGCL